MKLSSTIFRVLTFCLHVLFASGDRCSSIPLEDRLDCHPDSGADEATCNARGCCWTSSLLNGTGYSPPQCFYSGIYKSTGYQMQDLVKVNETFSYIDSYRVNASFVPNDIVSIRTEFSIQTRSRVRVKIYDPNNSRYEIPQKFLERPVDNQYSYSDTPDFTVVGSKEGNYHWGVRRKNEDSILDVISSNFIFANQFLQISFKESGSKLYGLGEHRAPFMYNVTQGKKVAIWARDQPVNTECNEYGSHPMYVMFESSGKAHAVVLMNSNAMDITMQPGGIITWRTIGGVLDFYILIGPSPTDVVAHYFDLIGHPYLPPYWGLGFHLSRYDYNSSKETWTVVNRTRAIGFPQEVQWNDIDYMNHHMDFTYSKENYSTLPELVADLHAHKQKYIMILDPGIYNEAPNTPLDDGTKMGIWINQTDGVTPLEGVVWPGKVYFPDFTNEKIEDYWHCQMKAYHNLIPYDGVWIDMNEPANFVDGSTEGCANNSLNYPPFLPAICDLLMSYTICPSAKQQAGVHYDLHNLYGHTEGIATNHALAQMFPNKRPVIITRSTTMGSGRYMGHWTGDNTATWDDLRWSISATLNSNLFGITFTGADICGFQLDTTEELCTRWMQMGAFYTFMRNHNDKNNTDQDPAVFSNETIKHMKHYALLRYQYLPYLYAQMFRAATEGQTVLTSLAFEFSHDENTHAIDTQFLWGHSVMVVPVLTQGATNVQAYFPEGVYWYELEDPAKVYKGGEWYTIDAPLSKLPLFVRAGRILVSQKPELYLTDARQNSITVEVFMPIDDDKAIGAFFWDDGESDLSLGQFTYVVFYLESNPDDPTNWYLHIDVHFDGYKDVPPLNRIVFHGVHNQYSVFMDEVSMEHEIRTTEQHRGMLVVENLNINLTKEFRMFLVKK